LLSNSLSLEGAGVWLHKSNHLDELGKALFSFLLAADVLVLLVFTGIAYGAKVYAPYFEHGTNVTSPPVSLQGGTVGSNTIYANNTSAKVSVVASRNWLSGWEKRVRIAIDNNDIDADLSNFPVLIYLSNSSSGRNNEDISFVFDELQSNANRGKIAATTSDGVTQINVEIERWNSTREQAWLWVKVPSISSVADTYLYLYFDKTQPDNTGYVGDTGSNAAKNVWDSNFKGVWHLGETVGGSGSIKDSTSNSNNGTTYGNPTLGAAGPIDNAINFDGVDDYISIPNSASLQLTSSLTIEAWIKLDSFGSGSEVDAILRKGEANPNDYQLAGENQQLALMIEENDDQGLNSVSSLSSTAWYYVTGTWNGSTRKVYLNGSENGSGSKTGSITPDTRAIYIGGRSGADLSDGIIDEVRASNTTRSAAWVRAGYESERDDLLDFGSEELRSYYPANYNILTGNWISGTVPASVKTVDSSYFVVRSASSANSTSAYNASGYTLIGNTTLVSGAVGDLGSNDGVYMTFRSYASATSGQTLYAHQETTTIGGSSYYFQRPTSADAAGTTLSASAATTGRKLMGRFVHQLTGVSSIPASTWTIYYRVYRDSGGVAGHSDVDILVRMSNGTVRATIATNVANTPADSIPTSWSTISGTYSWTAYTVVSQTDYLEIDYYIEVSNAQSGKSVYLRIDDNTLATTDQTRAANIILPSEFTSEVEFTSSSNNQTWSQLIRTVDSAWTTGSVSATIQLYNYTLGGYPTSGNGYESYTSSATANTDETKTQTITTNPTQFRNASGNWRIKVKGVKTTTTQFDFKADWVEFKSLQSTEFTASTDFYFSSTTTNTPTQLNFTVVSEYDIANVSVTIQVWNYSSSAYVTSGQGYLTYSSSGTNETKLLSINTSPQLYTSNGNARIRVTGLLATITQYQQKANQVKLTYSYTSASNYNYVLKIINQVSDTWKIRLRAYSHSNIARLNNCTIYFRNSTDGTSRQIYIQNGAYTNQTGPWYDLPANPAERYMAVTLDASNSQVSYVYVYLEILIPNKTTYAQYVIAFEIT